MTLDDLAGGAWRESEQRFGTMPRVREKAYTEGYKQAFRDLGMTTVEEPIDIKALVSEEESASHCRHCGELIHHKEGAWRHGRMRVSCNHIGSGHVATPKGYLPTAKTIIAGAFTGQPPQAICGALAEGSHGQTYECKYLPHTTGPHSWDTQGATSHEHACVYNTEVTQLKNCPAAGCQCKCGAIYGPYGWEG